MNIRLWYSEGMKEWRWTLTSKSLSPTGSKHQESGGRPFLGDAMKDIENTVEYLIFEKSKNPNKDK